MSSSDRGMASGYIVKSTLSSSSRYRQPSATSCRTIREGIVQLINGKHSSEKRYIKAVCGSNEGCPARLEVHKLKDTKSAKPYSGDSMTMEIIFTNVNYVSSREERRKKIITIGLEKSSKNISFCADSHSSTVKWYAYCGLLLTIPKYTIPEVPKENAALLQGIKLMNDSSKCDAANKWVVYILDEGVGHNIGLTGLCVVVLSTTKSTFNIYSFYTKEHLLRWHRDGIGVSGCIDSLVFLEADKMCYGGPGLLWMQHPAPQSMTLQEQLNGFLHAGPEEQRANSPVNHVAIGSPMSSAYIRNDVSQQLVFEDHPSDVSLGADRATSQSCTSLSSERSRCSSGYYSDSSCSRSSVLSLKKTQIPVPKVTCKHLTGKLTKDNYSSITNTSLRKASVRSSTPIQVTPSSTNSTDRCVYTCSSFTSLENGSTQKDMSSSTESHQYKTYISPSQSSSAKTSMIPKLSGYESISGHCASYGCHLPATLAHPSTLQDPNEVTSLHCSSLNQKTSTATTSSKHHMQKTAFQKCSVIITENLNISAIFPHLNSQELLTEKDCDILLSVHLTDVYKRHYLLNELPTKGEEFFNKFLYCLRQTKCGTGHGDIEKALSTSYKEIQESFDRVGTLMMPHTTDC